MICSIGLFTGCSDDEEEIVDNSWEELVGDYSGENLVLSYGDMALTGKKVTFSATSGNNGKLLLNNISREKMKLQSLMSRLKTANFQEQLLLLMLMWSMPVLSKRK